jgi:ubiquinone/menaquinone biosynthesis C-methylase UbiE
MDWVEQFFDGPFYSFDYAQVAEDTERTAQEAEFIRTQLGLQPGDRVLDLACGSGRHVLALAPYAASILGTDRTVSMIEQAKLAKREIGATNVEFEQQDMRELAFEGEFDAVYNYFTAWGYYDDKTNFDILRRVFRALRPGGRLLVEMLNRDAVMRRFRARDWNWVDGSTAVLYERRVDFTKGRFHSTYTYLKDGQKSVIEIDHYVPTGDALVRHLQDAGFTDVALVSAPDGGEVTMDTWRIAVIGTRAS